MELQCEIERDREKGRHMGGGREELRGDREHINVTMYTCTYFMNLCVCVKESWRNDYKSTCALIYGV